ncbi:MAG TPA: hypothetical protein VF873_10205, partial [Gemmatimonadales bacterium]
MSLAVPAALRAQGRPCDPPTPLGPSHDLYCLELVPAPGVAGVSGRVELASPPGPFTVAVTADGHSRFIPIAFLSGLPRTTHDARRTDVVSIAWAVSPQMDTLIKLGPVRNGRTTLRSIDLDKFLILISTERSTSVSAPRGRMILRGQSPSTRPFPPDVLEFSVGGMSMPEAMEHHHDDSTAWPMPPVPAGLT